MERRNGMRRLGSISVAGLLVLLVAGCGGTGMDDGGGGTTPGPGDVGPTFLEVEAGDLYLMPERLKATPGEVAFVLSNAGSADHDLVIEEIGDIVVARAAPGETASGRVLLPPGLYTYYCAIPGHRPFMMGLLEVH